MGGFYASLFPTAEPGFRARTTKMGAGRPQDVTDP